MKRIGFYWLDVVMVGSVLMDRMRAEKDFDLIDEPVFFTTSQEGQQGPDIGKAISTAKKDASDLDELKSNGCHCLLPGVAEYTKQCVWQDSAQTAGRAIGLMPPPPLRNGR